MTMRLATIALSLALAWTPGRAQSGAPPDAPAPAADRLAIGDAAPALAIESWVRGDPVGGFEKGRTYLIQFWSPFSRASLEQLALLTRLQKRYADERLTVLAVASTDVTGTTLEQVRGKVADLGETITFAVAWDRGTATKDAFLKAAGRSRLPCAALVDSAGRIAFLEDAPRVTPFLERVLRAEHDYAALAAWHAKAERAPQTERELQAAIEKHEWAEAVARTDDLLEVDPFQYGAQAQQRFLMQALGLKQIDEAYAWARAFSAGPGHESAEACNAIAWAIVDPANTLPRRDLELALRCAQRATELTQRTDGAILDTLARVMFRRGDVPRAIEIQREALQALTPALEQYRTQLEAALKEYEAALEKERGRK